MAHTMQYTLLPAFCGLWLLASGWLLVDPLLTLTVFWLSTPVALYTWVPSIRGCPSNTNRRVTLMPSLLSLQIPSSPLLGLCFPMSHFSPWVETGLLTLSNWLYYSLLENPSELLINLVINLNSSVRHRSPFIFWHWTPLYDHHPQHAIMRNSCNLPKETCSLKLSDIVYYRMHFPLSLPG